MKKSNLISIIIISFILIIAVLSWQSKKDYKKYLSELTQAKWIEDHRYDAIAKETTNLIDQCKKRGDKPISILGKCIVWDVSKNQIHTADSYLPSQLRAIRSDTIPVFSREKWELYKANMTKLKSVDTITVFMVLPATQTLVGTYSTSGQSAFRQNVDICVAYWPALKAIGMHSISGWDPSTSRQVSQYAQYGDLNMPIQEWISSLKCISR